MNSKELSGRIKAHCLLKGIGSTVAIGCFFVVYFLVLRNPIFPVQMVPVLKLDHWVPVLPWSMWIYFSLWVYVCMPHALMREVRPMGYYLLGSVVLAVLGLFAFVVWPTAVPEWNIDWNNYPALAFLKATDASGNACPSLHVAFAVFSGLWLEILLSHLKARPVWHWVNRVWCLAIILSTLTTKQHVLWDVLPAVGLGLLVFAINYRWLRRAGVTL